MENTKKVLLFHVKKEKRLQIENLCRDLEIKVILVEYKQYLEPLGVIAGIQGIPKSGKIYQGMNFPMEMMIFSMKFRKMKAHQIIFLILSLYLFTVG